VLDAKLLQLRQLIASFGSCLTAYSGGVDSVFLAYIAHGVLGSRALAVIADSPSLPRRELAEALSIAQTFRFPLRVVQTREFSNPEYLANPANRCYFCKFELFSELTPIAAAEGFTAILYGENASDTADIRPGAQAAAEFNIRAPLKETGLTKADIRTLSAELGLPTAEKPQLACLSSRIPHGEPVTLRKLDMVERAENLLRDLGFHEVRVRHHAITSPGMASAPTGATPIEAASLPNSGPQASLARIEVGPDEFQRLMEPAVTRRIHTEMQAIGYLHVTLDLQGYRRPGRVTTSAADRSAGH